MEADTGSCFALIPRYFFNTKTGTCEMFTYGGCGGNGNNYKTLQECTQQCNPNGGLIMTSVVLKCHVHACIEVLTSTQ